MYSICTAWVHECNCCSLLYFFPFGCLGICKAISFRDWTIYTRDSKLLLSLLTICKLFDGYFERDFDIHILLIIFFFLLNIYFGVTTRHISKSFLPISVHLIYLLNNQLHIIHVLYLRKFYVNTMLLFKLCGIISFTRISFHLRLREFWFLKHIIIVYINILNE